MQKLLILVFCLFSVTANASTLVKSYGFEDWGGTIETTSDYLFGSGYSEFCTAHQEMSEVVSAYDGTNPHGGGYMFLGNIGSAELSPAVSGITGIFQGNSYNQGWHEGAYCTQSTFNITTDVGNIIYVQMWVKLSGWETTTGDSKLKLLNFYNATTADVTFYVVPNVGDSGNPQIALWSVNGTSASYSYGGTINLNDGNWHKIALYVDYSDGGEAHIWYDEDSPTLANSVLSHTADAGYNMYWIDTLYLAENWSAHTPTGESWIAIDDIEVWNGLPTEEASVMSTGAFPLTH